VEFERVEVCLREPALQLRSRCPCHATAGGHPTTLNKSGS
jgi:hypothetical protein